VRTEYRAFWVDTFNTNLNNHTDVVNMVNNAKAAKANALFVQVRRRGDSWYLNSQVVAERLGHSSTMLTLDVYSHVVAGMQSEATACIEKRLCG
jgi:uncharacterized lipoprotein YddW (UPF0748 family)